MYDVCVQQAGTHTLGVEILDGTRQVKLIEITIKVSLHLFMGCESMCLCVLPFFLPCNHISYCKLQYIYSTHAFERTCAQHFHRCLYTIQSVARTVDKIKLDCVLDSLPAPLGQFMPRLSLQLLDKYENAVPHVGVVFICLQSEDVDLICDGRITSAQNKATNPQFEVRL